VRGDPTTPYYFTDDAARPVSCWHRIPLAPPNAEPGVYNMVCEIPRGTRAKYEIATHVKYNPIVQDVTRGGAPRYYAFPSLSNYGALPQTYEDPGVRDPRTQLAGDGDPLDVCEIGLRTTAEATGNVYAVRVLGALAMVDDGETDWKLLAVRTDDPLAALVSDVATAPASVRRLMDDIRTWFRTYKVPEGKGENTFALGGEWQGRDVAMEVVAECHAQWRALHDAAAAADTGAPLFGAAGIAAATAKRPWVRRAAHERDTADFNQVEASLAKMRVSRELDLK